VIFFAPREGLEIINSPVIKFPDASWAVYPYSKCGAVIVSLDRSRELGLVI